MGRLGWTAEPIRDERAEADRIKREQRIMAIIGNPPYWRFEGVNAREMVGPFVDDLWQDLKEPVRAAGWANQLNTFPEFSVAFWRWSIWKLFEADNAPGRGVIAFITNRTFLAGKPYAGLRKMLRERFDRIEVIDLRGDLRRGARAGVVGDTGVFNIQVGTAITLAIATGEKKKKEAEVQYADVWEEDLFTRESKLAWLDAAVAAGKVSGSIGILRSGLEDFKPMPFAQQRWTPINRCFLFASSGIETTRDHLSYGLSEDNLVEKLNLFMAADTAKARDIFAESRRNDSARAKSHGFSQSNICQVSYRPLDLRFLINAQIFVDWPRPQLQAAWGGDNFALFSLPSSTGAGPAVWSHALLPDRHAFRGSYGGYAFPLYDRRPGHGSLNLAPQLLEALALAYAGPVAPETVFDAILALLSATSYTLRFAEDLEDVFPHVPFPADRAVFERAAAIGAAIRAVETFARLPAAEFLTPQMAKIETTPVGLLDPSDFEGGTLTLSTDGSGRVTGIPEPIWSFAVSGYRLLPRWLAARRGHPVNWELINSFRDIVGRIAELIHHFGEADLVLADALQHSLTSDELGLSGIAGEAKNERSE
jgi:predicted helicase